MLTYQGTPLSLLDGFIEQLMVLIMPCNEFLNRGHRRRFAPVSKPRALSLRIRTV